MKKKIMVGIITLFSCVSVYAMTNSFVLDSSKLTFSSGTKEDSIVKNFNEEYKLSYKIESKNDQLKDEITDLSKKVTYLLLGDFNTESETSEEYYKRHQEYLILRYNPEVPKKDGTFTGLDEESQEYLDDLVSGICIPGMFLKLNEMGVVYNSFGDIRVSISDDIVISSVSLPNIKIKEENKDNPMEYEIITTNLVMYYYFKELNGEYKLYYMIGEKTDNLNQYFNEIESNEEKNMYAIMPTYDSGLNEIYDYSKIESLSQEQISQIYKETSSNIVSINSYYENQVVASANGMIIYDGIVVTTWDFMEKALSNSQFIVIKDNAGNYYDIDGIITANPQTDIVVIKLKEKVESTIKIGDSDKLQIEDAVLTISTKTGVGLSVQGGIVISNDGYIQSAIPLSDSDQGSPLINANGEVVGINTSKSTNSSISMAISSNILKEIQEKFKNIDFNSIQVITFDDLKEQYYYINYNEETIFNNISKRVWNKYSKIGKIEENVKLKLVKANYTDGILSLRYQNEISNFIGSMQLISTFKDELLAEGYNNTLDSESKCIFENDKYQIVIMDEFNYLIIVMVKK